MGKFVSGGPRDAHTGCSNSPGFGSGMTWNPCNEKIYTITDRGPNQDCGDIDDDYKAGKVPNRSPGVSSGKGWDDGSEIVLEVDWVRVYENQS